MEFLREDGKQVDDKWDNPWGNGSRREGVAYAIRDCAWGSATVYRKSGTKEALILIMASSSLVLYSLLANSGLHRNGRRRPFRFDAAACRMQYPFLVSTASDMSTEQVSHISTCYLITTKSLYTICEMEQHEKRVICVKIEERAHGCPRYSLIIMVGT